MGRITILRHYEYLGDENKISTETTSAAKRFMKSRPVSVSRGRVVGAMTKSNIILYIFVVLDQNYNLKIL